MSSTKQLTPAQRSAAFTGSEHYAAGRMTHAVIVNEKLNQTQSEVVHDALMAAFQAGYLACVEGTSVDDLLGRMVEEDVRGCSCGEADYDAPGHDGDPNGYGHSSSS